MNLSFKRSTFFVSNDRIYHDYEYGAKIQPEFDAGPNYSLVLLGVLLATNMLKILGGAVCLIQSHTRIIVSDGCAPLGELWHSDYLLANMGQNKKVSLFTGCRLCRRPPKPDDLMI